MKRIELLDKAEADLDSAILWYSVDMELAADFYMEFWKKVDLIQRFPELFPAYGVSYRRALLKKYPYSVIYRDLPETIEIHAVFHLSRKDEHWLT